MFNFYFALSIHTCKNLLGVQLFGMATWLDFWLELSLVIHSIMCISPLLEEFLFVGDLPYGLFIRVDRAWSSICWHRLCFGYDVFCQKL